ncbi:DUF6241 domain-containing protein [Shouchella lehensis]|uniref:Uncharacterized protein n=1 Tax=Shouchella lehensis TaxID=300825 RepID=A0A4Y7WHY6_9BACI|nr:DUF6241 domain-containing protein [Shouchella lehensis]TES47887.1 hypothetical protein E2L03_12140 [Shouchella lehensis]
MKKFIIFLSIVGVIGLIGFGGFYFGQNALERMASSEEQQGSDTGDDLNNHSGESGVQTEELVLTASIDEDLHDLFPKDLSERAMQEAIHYMSHGLVEAEQKWGKIQLTEERIEWLLDIATVRADEFTHGSRYEQILLRWHEGDFSQAVEDHNFVWELWGGTIGKATRLLTPAEVDTYNDKHF